MNATTKSAWEVFALFVIPIGGGIPAGVVLGKTRGVTWPILMGLFFLSDLLLAVCFEPLMLWVIARGKQSPKVTHFLEALKESSKRTTPKFVNLKNPFSLIGATFLMDPMSGRVLAKAAGHGFITGWALAITGDMMYFTVIMTSTLWLSHILGDGTMAMVVMLVLMFALPSAIEKIRQRRAAKKAAPPPA